MPAAGGNSIKLLAGESLSAVEGSRLLDSAMMIDWSMAPEAKEALSGDCTRPGLLCRAGTVASVLVRYSHHRFTTVTDFVRSAILCLESVSCHNTGSSHPTLAQAVADRLGIALTPVTAAKFSAGETNVQIHQSIREEDVYILQTSNVGSVNDNLMELLVLASGESRHSRQESELRLHLVIISCTHCFCPSLDGHLACLPVRSV